MSIDYDEIRNLILSGKCGEAELQIMHSFQGVGHGNLVDALEQSATRADLDGDIERADALYKMSLAFFETCLPEQQSGGLAALRKYAEFLVKHDREDELGDVLDRFAPIVLKIANSLLVEVEQTKAGSA